MDWISAILKLVPLVADLGFSFWKAGEGDQEKAYKDAWKADKQAISGGRGGMSDYQRNLAMSQIQGQAAAQQNAQLAEAMRGANTGAGESGMLATKEGDIQSGYDAALRGGQSDMRAQDIALAESRYRDILRRMEQTVNWELQRKANTATTAPSGMSGQTNQADFTTGQSTRTSSGDSVNATTEGISGASGMQASDKTTSGDAYNFSDKGTGGGLAAAGSSSSMGGASTDRTSATTTKRTGNGAPAAPKAAWQQ